MGNDKAYMGQSMIRCENKDGMIMTMETPYHKAAKDK
jgi:hypothetical protein